MNFHSDDLEDLAFIDSRRPPCVLIAEDEPSLREALRLVLEEESYTTLLAANGAEAALLARSHRPDLVLTDLSMRGGDGMALLKALRRDASTAAIPLVFFTAWPDERHAAIEAGAFAYLEKPVRLQRLLETVFSGVCLGVVGRAGTAGAVHGSWPNAVVRPTAAA